MTRLGINTDKAKQCYPLHSDGNPPKRYLGAENFIPVKTESEKGETEALQCGRTHGPRTPRGPGPLCTCTDTAELTAGPPQRHRQSSPVAPVHVCSLVFPRLAGHTLSVLHTVQGREDPSQPTVRKHGRGWRPTSTLTPASH